MASDDNRGAEVSGEPADFEQTWKETCQEVEAVHREMAEFVGEPFRQFFVDEATKLRQLGAPTTQSELNTRRLQRAALSGKIAALAEAASLAILNPHLTSIIARDAERLCQEPLPESHEALPDYHRSLLKFTARLAIACRELQPKLP